MGSFPETNNDPKFLLGQAEFLTGQNIGGEMLTNYPCVIFYQ